jgi:putative tryptophan/tyrosine transport system ATP-binding protein
MLEAYSIAKTFHAGTPNEVRSLRGVSLTLKPGSWVIIIGTNGSGKSTFLNAVAGTVSVDQGSIRLAGRDVTRWPEYARAEFIGRVFQNPFSGTSPSLTIRENLSLAVRRGRSRGLGWGLKSSLLSKMREEISRLNMGLEDRLENAIGSLSGGQRQALTLLMATWVRPELLLLDEHTAALDPKSADRLIALTEQVVAQEELTTLMVTHSMHQAASLGDRLIMMHRGQIIHDIQGAEKRRLRPDDLLARFEEVRRAEQLDESAAQMLAERYI